MEADAARREITVRPIRSDQYVDRCEYELFCIDFHNMALTLLQPYGTYRQLWQIVL